MQHFERFEDLVSDESFLSWYYKSNNDDIAKWELWIQQAPENKKLVNEAVDFLKYLNVSEAHITDSQLALAEKSIREKILQGDEEIPVVSIQRKSTAKWWWAAAAIVVIGLGMFLFKPFSPAGTSSTFSTNFGEIARQQLPDGSEVFVNANSNITYNKNWKQGQDREVWIKGEAFFSVKKTPARDRFIVHTSQFDIVVTGTQFNVVDRNDRVNVSLKEGSVYLLTKDGKEIQMKPGDFVELRNEQMQQKELDAERAIAWKERKLSFENTPMTEVASMIKEIYGVTIRLGDESIKSKTLTGIMPNNNLEVLLKSIEASLECKIVKEGAEIIISEK